VCIAAWSAVRDRCASAVSDQAHSPRRRRIGSAPSHAQTGGVGHADAGRAFRLARRRFVAGERLDMGALAADLGTPRLDAHTAPIGSTICAATLTTAR